MFSHNRFQALSGKFTFFYTFEVPRLYKKHFTSFCKRSIDHVSRIARGFFHADRRVLTRLREALFSHNRFPALSGKFSFFYTFEVPRLYKKHFTSLCKRSIDHVSRIARGFFHIDRRVLTRLREALFSHNRFQALSLQFTLF